MKNHRKLRAEPLEERTLLAVAAGGIETAAELAVPTEAAVWVVNTLEDPAEWDTADDLLSLREAIDRAAAGDTIVFDTGLAGGTITLHGSQLEIDAGITINAAAIGGITIDANRESRVFYVDGETGGMPVELVGLTITGGDSFSGGAVFNYGFLSLTDCSITGNNSGYLCGGIYNYAGTVAMTGCTVSENSAGYSGGGIYNDNGVLAMTDCVIGQNSGGGICDFAGSVTLTGCTFTGNSAAVGGGVYTSSGNVVMTACVVSGNSAEQDGGGICAYFANMTLINCAVFGNRAGSHGGGIQSDSSGLALLNCSVSGNRSEAGGGAAVRSGSFTLTNSVIALNSADFEDDVDLDGSDFSGANDLIGFDPGFSRSPVFNRAGDLLNLSEIDLSLTETSIAIDRGDSSAVTAETDILGHPRRFASRTGEAVVDIGAYEFQNKASREIETPSAIVTTLSDVTDSTDGLISLREALFYAEPGETVTFDRSICAGTITLNGTELWCIKSVTIDARSSLGITIDAGGKSRVLCATAGTDRLPMTLAGLTMTGGYAEFGGGIYNSGVLSMTACSLYGNSAREGGGIQNDSGRLILTDCAVFGNRAEIGGGIRNDSGNVVLTGCTVTANGSEGNKSGSGISNFGVLNLTNSIVALNGAGDIDNEIVPGQRGAFSGTNNIVGFDPGFAVPPIFDEMGNLTNFGALDISLSETSWGIDRGTNSAVTTELDLAGNPRINASRNPAGIVDIGAYEYQESFARETESPSVKVTVNTDIIDETDGEISLREAVLYAEPGQTVTFDASLAGKTILLEEGEIWIDKSITIDASGIGGMQIDAGWTSRIFYISGGERELPVHLTALTVTGGLSDGGSAICNTGTLVLTDCVLADNIAEGVYPCGGAVSNGGDLTMIGCTLSENSAAAESFYSSYGGAVYNSAFLSLDHCILSDNAASYGGGIYSDGGTVTVQKTSFSGNIADSSGGGISNIGGTLTVIGSLFTENRGETSGGGIDNAGDAVLINCGLFGNHAYNGGGLCNESVSSLTLTGCTVVKNTAVYGGGGIYSYYLYDPGNVILENSIVLLNTAAYFGADIYNTVGIKGVHSLSAFTDWNESYGTLIYDPSKPLFADPEKGDFTLAVDSQAVNAGDNDCVMTETDLAGNSRIVDGIVDIGAYECQKIRLAAPAILTGSKGVYVSYGANRHQVTWTPVENAAGYELTYTSDNRDGWTSVITAETSAVITGLTYGDVVAYRVRALGEGTYIDSGWSAGKAFAVCPMDINGDGDISAGDRAILASCWLAGKGDDGYIPAADIDADGDISNGDRQFLSSNWLCAAGDDDLAYPRPLAAFDAVFAEFASGDLVAEPDVF